MVNNFDDPENEVAIRLRRLRLARGLSQRALAKAAGEALTFSGIEAGAMDVAFFEADSPVAASLARVGLKFDLPQPEEPKIYQPEIPGSNPDKPPRLV